MMDIGFLRMMPNIVLTAPASEIELKLALEFAIRENKPVVIRYPKDLVPSKEFDTDVIGTCAKPFEAGKSVVVREHKDSVITIVTYGCILIEAVEAAKLLAKDGIEVDVINARFADPLDESRLIDILRGSSKGIITVEDHSTACGFGSAVLESVAAALTKGISKPIVILGSSKNFIKHNSRDTQLMQSGVNADNIAKTAKQLLSKLKTSKRGKS
jgi:1-deoxy-D-xylulose-5-phosphate synthase